MKSPLEQRAAPIRAAESGGATKPLQQSRMETSREASLKAIGSQLNERAGVVAQARLADDLSQRAFRDMPAPLQAATNRTSLPDGLKRGVGGVAAQRAAIAQLMRTDLERRNLAAPFRAATAHLMVGYLTAESNLRNEARDKVGAPSAAGCMIVFDGAIRDNFSVGPTNVEKDHVYGMVVSNSAREPILNAAQWRKGWIVYEHVDTDATRSGALRAALGNAASDQNIIAYLTGLGAAAPRTAKTRVETAPRAIKAWAEKSGTDLSAAVDLQDAALWNGLDFHAALANDANRNAYATIDPQNDLNLSRLDPNSALFANFTGFLNANAAAMPGTMGKDHELRDDATGGARAAAGRAWLRASGINDDKPGFLERDTRPEFVAITGAQVANIFINDHAPTWAAYNQNVAALQAQMQQPVGQQPLVVPAPAPAFAPWQTLQQGQGNLQNFIQGFTQPRPGEHYLFHGTKRDSVFNIAKTGFDPEFVNYTFPKGYGKTGYGTAFTDQFAKALAYAPPEAVNQPVGGPIYKHYVLVARVFVGRAYDVGDQARRTRGNLELTKSNLNYEEARGNKMRAQGQGMPLLGKASDTVQERLDAGEHLHSTLQHRNFDLTLEATQALPAQAVPRYRDTSVTVSDAIQMYPMFIIEATIPQANVRRGARR